jgi:hypothetical protein
MEDLTTMVGKRVEIWWNASVHKNAESEELLVPVSHGYGVVEAENDFGISIHNENDQHVFIPWTSIASLSVDR